jgi:hypothetical protein
LLEIGDGGHSGFGCGLEGGGGGEVVTNLWRTETFFEDFIRAVTGRVILAVLAYKIAVD